MRSLGNLLGVEAVKQAPAEFKVDELLPVVSIDPAWAGYEPFTLYDATAAINGQAFWTWEVAGTGSGNTSGIDTSLATLQNQEKEAVILGINIQVLYNAAGITADDGISVSLQFYRQAANSLVSVVPESILPRWYTVGVGSHWRNAYYWSMPMWAAQYVTGPQPLLYHAPIWVPAGSKLQITADRSEGTWPAATSLSVAAHGVWCPKGMRPPGL